MNDFLKEFAEEWKIDRDMPDCVEEGEWEQDYKYQYNTSVYKYKDRFVRVNQSRSGSYHSDWYYNDPTFDEVVPRKVIKEFIIYDGVK
jgi:hypothetical protein